LLLFSLSASTAIISYSLQEAITDTTTNDFLTYKNSTLGIKIQYPVDWYRVNGNDSSVRFVAPQEGKLDRQLGELIISVGPSFLCGNISVTKFFELRIADLQESNVGFNLLEQKSVILKDNNAAQVVVYTLFDPVYGTLKGHSVGIIKGNKLYTIGFLAKPHQYQIYLPTIQKMIDSFEILNSENTIKTISDKEINEKNGFQVYNNSNYGISMNYPVGWEKIENDTTPRDYDIDVVEFNNPDCGPGYTVDFSIMIRLYTEDLIPQNVAEELEYVIDRGNLYSTDFNVIESNSNITLSGYPAYKIVWTEEITEGIIIKVMEIGTIIDGSVYVITFRAEVEKYYDYLPVIEKMIDSLKIE
jgi:hypothetical protein